MIVYYLFNYKLNYWLCIIHIWLQIFQSMDFRIYLTISRLLEVGLLGQRVWSLITDAYFQIAFRKDFPIYMPTTV